MEAHFHHWIKKIKNSLLLFITQFCLFFLTVAWYTLAFLTFFSELWDINAQLQEKSNNFQCVSHNSVFITLNWEFISHYSEKKSQNCEIKSRNSLCFFLFLFFSVAETGFHTSYTNLMLLLFFSDESQLHFIPKSCSPTSKYLLDLLRISSGMTWGTVYDRIIIFWWTIPLNI